MLLEYWRCCSVTYHSLTSDPWQYRPQRGGALPHWISTLVQTLIRSCFMVFLALFQVFQSVWAGWGQCVCRALCDDCSCVDLPAADGWKILWILFVGTEPKNMGRREYCTGAGQPFILQGAPSRYDRDLMNNASLTVFTVYLYQSPCPNTAPGWVSGQFPSVVEEQVRKK